MADSALLTELAFSFSPDKLPPAQCRAGPFDAFAGLDQSLVRRGIGHPEMGRQTEGRAVNRRNPLCFENIAAEIEVCFNYLAVRGCLANQSGNRRIDIEGSLGLRAVNAVNLVEHINHHIPAFLKYGGTLTEEMLGAGQGLDRCGL